MFVKHPKKIFPPGTFIQTQPRVCAIIQLCLAFTLLLWILFQPFSGEHFSLKSKLILFEYVIGNVQGNDDLQENAKLFHALPKLDQELILEEFKALNKQLHRTFFQKITKSLSLLVYETPLFQIVWLVLSFIIPIMLLKRVEGAIYIVWLLPLVTAFYGIDNRLNGQIATPSADEQFFPKEQILVDKYLDQPLSSDIFTQKEQLQKAWNSYLINVWSDKGIKEGEYAFNFARLKYRISKGSQFENYQIQDSLALLALYFFWNVFFAATACRLIIREDYLPINHDQPRFDF